MQSPAQSPATPPTPQPTATFAGLLAALTAPNRKPPASAQADAWNDSDLRDDVATLSYERALRTHARYRPADPGMPPFTEASDAEPPSRWEEAIAEPAQTSESAEEHARLEHTYLEHPHWADTELPREIALPAEGAKERNLRRTSITIRMSSEENLQLRKRAAEAGLTVSAYLRSCTFEAESLRALVKDTLAQLRASAETKNGRKAAKPRHRWRDWMNLLWSHDEDGEQISGL